jgi:hypothetical protein
MRNHFRAPLTISAAKGSSRAMGSISTKQSTSAL